MRYKIIGVDAITGEPIPPAIVEAATRQEAVDIAREQGIEARESEAMDQEATAEPRARSTATSRRTLSSTTRPLVTVLRVSAAMLVLLQLGKIIAVVEDADSAEQTARSFGQVLEVPIASAILEIILQTLVGAALLIAAAQLLLIALAVEMNTRTTHGGTPPTTDT